MGNKQAVWRSVLSLTGLYLIVILFSACPAEKPAGYSFFIAGHTYGVKEKTVPGLHMPFVAEFNYLNAYPDLRFGVLAGDIVYYSRDIFWDAVDKQLEDLEFPVYFTTGNHDEGHKSPYRERYGNTFYSFEQGHDLCIVLNPGLGGWNIWREQMTFLQEQMAKSRSYDHIFIFFHHLLWWTAENEYRQFPPNSLDGRTPTTNFWEEVMPLLTECGRPVYCFAGDVGAAGRPTVFFADQRDNVHFIATGMGNGRKDNYVLVQVDPEDGVQVFVRWLQKQSTYQVFPAEENQLPYGATLRR